MLTPINITRLTGATPDERPFYRLEATLADGKSYTADTARRDMVREYVRLNNEQTKDAAWAHLIDIILQANQLKEVDALSPYEQATTYAAARGLWVSELTHPHFTSETHEHLDFVNEETGEVLTYIHRGDGLYLVGLPVQTRTRKNK